MNDFISLRGLHKRFGQVVALDSLDLDIREGEFFTLLGPSGCGKTTTLRLIGGLEKPDGGEVVVAGRCLASHERRIFVNPERRDMGMVFQSYALWPHMTVFENVAYPLKLRWMKKADVRARVSEVLGLVGLGGLEERPVPALSGGQQQRVALARALAFAPRILLLDEPLSNLDAQLRDEMRQELRSLQRRLGLTVVLVTHDQLEALSLSDRLAIMSGGRLEQLGTPEEVYHRPATPFVRDFLGKIFALPGKVRRVAGVTAEIELAGMEMPPLAVPRTQLPAAFNGSAAGRDVMIAIRPERITVADGAPSGEANVLRVAVREAQFLGDRYEYVMTIGIETRHLVLPASHFFRPGEEVYLRLPSDMITVWEP